MNRNELIKRISEVLKENNIRKPIKSARQVFHISDDEGNSRDFIIKKTDKSVMYTTKDIENVIDSCLHVIKESLKRGESVSVRGFGTLWLKHRKARATKLPGTDRRIDIDARYTPKFSFGDDLRRCAKIYELSLSDDKRPKSRWMYENNIIEEERPDAD